MRNKRGIFFMLYLVLLTLLMCGIVIGFYFPHQKTIGSSLVSPLSVLELRDDLEIFEMREKELIKKSLGEVDEKFGTDDFLSSFRENFIEGLNDEMKNFIFSNLTWNGIVMDTDFAFDKDSFFENILYPEIEISSDEFIFARGRIGKKIYLSANDKTKTNFPVDFLFEFERKYLINKNGGKFEVNAV